MGLGGAYRTGGDYKVIRWGASHKGFGPFSMAGVDHSRHQVNILIWQLEKG